MKTRYPQAPVVPHTIAYTTTGSTPVAIFNGSGTADLIITTAGVGAGVIFGNSASMLVASAANSLPIAGGDWFRMTIGPSTRFISVVSLDGNAGTLNYYLPGQTEV